jgi:beta-lactamase superfamily II metal-dependent hydrolase
MSIPIVRRALLGALVAANLAAPLIARPALAGSLDVVASFTAKTSQLDVATYTDPNQQSSKVGLLNISHSNAIALGAAQWKSLIELVHKAAAASAPAAWTEVGSMKDVSKDTATLTVSSGPGLRFVISSAKGGTLTHILPKADIARLEKALQQVGDRLSK